MKYNTGQEKVSNYNYTLQLFWGDLYGDGGVTVYSQQRFGHVKPSWTNAEHIFPMAWVVNSLNCRDRKDCRRHSKQFKLIESDLHNIYPARKDLNMARGSYSFGEVENKEHVWVDYDFEIDYKRKLVEPPHVNKGEIARAMFYIVDAYGLALFEKQAKLLRDWNQIDPPSEEEQRRNRVIEKLQQTRNYFIDHPDVIEDIWQQVVFNSNK
jgi:deoxyribonuclease-1